MEEILALANLIVTPVIRIYLCLNMNDAFAFRVEPNSIITTELKG